MTSAAAARGLMAFCQVDVQKSARRSGRAHLRASTLVCLLTVTCNTVDIGCVHLMAAGRVIGCTPRLGLDAAAHLASSGLITVDADTGICSCQALADVLKVVHFRPKEGFCTCYDRTLHGTCCHLQAAPLLAAFVGVELPAAAHHVAGDSETVSAAPVSYTPLRAHETVLDFVCRLLLAKKTVAMLNGSATSSTPSCAVSSSPALPTAWSCSPTLASIT